MDPGILVPPKEYGGHERLVYMFAKEYARLGHDVHLLVTTGSVVESCIIHGFGKEGFPPKKWDVWVALPKAWLFLWKRRKKFDLIHNFGRLAYLLPVLDHSVKKIMTYGREIRNRNIRILNHIPNRNLVFTGCSRNLISRVKAGGRWEVVYNAIPFKNYSLTETVSSDAPLIFLGRIEKIKGAHTAIEVAKNTGHRLILAGNISVLPEENNYFETQIKPHIDNQQIIYVGALNDEQKNYWLGQSKALLFPIEWNEPFGMVMIEAMACGTPVIAFNRGSVTEIVVDEINGIKVDNAQEMMAAIKIIHKIDRRNCRDVSKSFFDVELIAHNYLHLL